MSKTIESSIDAARIKMEMWKDIALDPQALKERGKTKEEALRAACFFDGQLSGLWWARNLIEL